MESEISFLGNPKLDLANLPYIENKKKVYANLYEIKIKKELKFCQYPYSVTPEIEAGDFRIRNKLFKACYKELKETYGECFILGDSLYGMKKIDEIKEVKAKIYLKGITEYKLNFQKCANEKIIKQEDVQKDQLTKQFIEILIRDILHANPKLDFYKGLFVRNDQEKKIETERVSIKFYPGFTTSFMETEGGNFLNVTLKNKIIQTDTILDFLIEYEYKIKENQENIRDLLIGRSFKVSYAKKNYKIDDILFDRNPKNQTFTYEGKKINLIEYYEKAHKLKIKDKTQPLLLVITKGPQEQINNLYFIPELCFLAGIEDSAAKDGPFMRELANYTKLNPTDRVKKTNEFLNLLIDPEKKDNKPENLSAKEKSELYGIEVKPVEKLFDAYYMKDTKLIGGENEEVNVNDKTFPVLDKKNMKNWLCFYQKGKKNYYDAEKLYNTLNEASKAFGINIAEPYWREMPFESSVEDWTKEAKKYIGNGKKNYSFAVFLLDKYNEYMYPELKKHSLVKNGYVSQVIKTSTLKNNRIMSICNKILLQINAKLRGTSYMAEVDKEVDEKEIMIVGVDSSHIKGKRTGVAMVASINKNFTDFFNKEKLIKEEKKEELCFCVSSFLEEALAAFLKQNKKLPKNIIIYRQGVSLQQKEYLKSEIKQIDECLKIKNIKYYYILVNTKTTFKFFEKSGNEYNNPEAGLLIMGGITNKNFFEFYIQPQKVTGGSATPTCFHVAYGNMDCPKIIPKFTYDLCHIYSNWQGTVRIPNVIKCAEKLSKMTAKYTVNELNNNLKLGQAYL